MRKGRSQGDEESKEEVLALPPDDWTPIDCEAVMDRITSTDIAVELEADGSISVTLDDISCILDLGISPSQILQVIQDGLLSVRTTPALPSDMVRGDLWDTDSGLAVSCEGFESDASHVGAGNPDADLQGCKTAPEDRRPPGYDDMSAEIDALFAAQFREGNTGLEADTLKTYPSIEECCSSFGSIEDILARAHSKSDILEDMLDDLGEAARTSQDSDICEVFDTSKPLIEQSTSITQNDAMSQSMCDRMRENPSQTTEVDILSGGRKLLCNEVDTQEVLYQAESNIQDNNNENKKNCSDFGSHRQFDDAKLAFSQILFDKEYDDPWEEQAKVVKRGEEKGDNLQGCDGRTEGWADVTEISEVQSKDEKQEQTVECLSGSESCCRDVPVRNRQGTLSCVVDSLLDLAASLEEEERNIESAEQGKHAYLDFVKAEDSEKKCSVTEHKAKELSPEDNSFVAKDQTEAGNIGPIQIAAHGNQSAQGCTKANICSTSGVEEPVPHHLQEKDEHLTHGTDVSAAIPSMKDHIYDASAPRHSTPKLTMKRKPPFRKGHSFDSMIQRNRGNSPEKQSSKGFPRSRSLVRVFSGFLQKYDIFDTKQSDTTATGKGLRSSLKRKFMNRSVPDISKLHPKPSMEGSTCNLQDEKKVWSSSTNDVRSAETWSPLGSEALCGIMEESRASRTSSMSKPTEVSANEINSNKVNEPVRSRPSAGDDHDRDHNRRNRDELAFVLESYIVRGTEDKSIQTDLTSQAVSDHQDSKDRSRVGKWHREGSLTRPLSCPALPDNDMNKNHIVYFHDQPIGNTPDMHPRPQKDTEMVAVTIDIQEKTVGNSEAHSNLVCDLPDMAHTDAHCCIADGENDFGSHICVVKGCNCDVNDLSTLLDSALLKETCFSGDEEDESALDMENKVSDCRTIETLEAGVTASSDQVTSNEFICVTTDKLGNMQNSDFVALQNDEMDISGTVDSSDYCPSDLITMQKSGLTSLNQTNENDIVTSTTCDPRSSKSSLDAPPTQNDERILSDPPEVQNTEACDIIKPSDLQGNRQQGVNTVRCEKEGDIKQCNLDEEEIVNTVNPLSSTDTSPNEPLAYSDGLHYANRSVMSTHSNEQFVSTQCFSSVESDASDNSGDFLSLSINKPAAHESEDDFSSQHLGTDGRAISSDSHSDRVMTLDPDSAMQNIPTLHDTKTETEEVSNEDSHDFQGNGGECDVIKSSSGCNVSSVSTHLGVPEKRATFRSEYYRSFDENDSDDDTDLILPGSHGPPRSTIETSPDFKEGPCNHSTDNAQKLDIGSNTRTGTVPLDLSSDLQSSDLSLSQHTQDTDVSSETDNTFCGEVEPLDLEVESYSVEDMEDSTKVGNLLSSDANGSRYSPMLSETETELSSSCCAINEMFVCLEQTEASTKLGNRTYDIVNSLEELSTALNGELAYGNGLEKTYHQESQLQHAADCITPKLCQKVTTDSDILLSENESSGDSVSSLPLSKCSLTETSKGGSKRQCSVTPRAATEREEPLNHKIGSATSTSVLGQVPKQMSAYSYSDSDSDYDSTASGSSQETVVEVMSAHPGRARVRSSVPPKSNKVKPSISRQRSGVKPPVPPKPLHLKTLVAEKRTKESSRKNRIASQVVSSSTEAAKHLMPEADLLMPEADLCDSVSNSKENDVGKTPGSSFSIGTSAQDKYNQLVTPDLSKQECKVRNSSFETHNEWINKTQTFNGLASDSSIQKKDEKRREALGIKYNVAMRKRTYKGKVPLEQRHSTGSLFSLANLPCLDGSSLGKASRSQKMESKQGSPELWDASESLTLGRKKTYSQRVYFMLNV